MDPYTPIRKKAIWIALKKLRGPTRIEAYLKRSKIECEKSWQEWLPNFPRRRMLDNPTQKRSPLKIPKITV
jgi:hypothetical protein